jgi:hypothetical protein
MSFVMANSQHHFGQLIKNMKPMKANIRPAIPTAPIINQTRIVPIVAIIENPQLLKSPAIARLYFRHCVVMYSCR